LRMLATVLKMTLDGSQVLWYNRVNWAWQLWSDGSRTIMLMALEGQWGLADIRVITQGR